MAVLLTCRTSRKDGGGSPDDERGDKDDENNGGDDENGERCRDSEDSEERLIDWHNHKYEVAKPMNSIIKGYGGLKDVAPFPSQYRLVFTHLHLGEDGRIWLINFGLLGFHPEWFEFVAVLDWEAMGWLGRLGRRVIAGYYGKQALFIDYIS
ncbi:hypothetical protein C8Q80DRAFT_1267196 [Daedaleopsis nitida]|nr:hypothetical protein C8Q80DRAFT_1267196 [Daedaleopsis nitida]